MKTKKQSLEWGKIKNPFKKDNLGHTLRTNKNWNREKERRKNEQEWLLTLVDGDKKEQKEEWESGILIEDESKKDHKNEKCEEEEEDKRKIQSNRIEQFLRVVYCCWTGTSWAELVERDAWIWFSFIDAIYSENLNSLLGNEYAVNQTQSNAVLRSKNSTPPL